jgi:hypothetical protein
MSVQNTAMTPSSSFSPASLVEADFAGWEAARRREAPAFFAAPGAPVCVARAPGRLDVMGGIADYSGSLVAEMPIAQAALVGAQRDDGAGGGTVTVRSGNAAENGLAPEVVLPAELFVNPVSLLKHLRSGPAEERWAGYAAGCLALLRAEGSCRAAPARGCSSIQACRWGPGCRPAPRSRWRPCARFARPSMFLWTASRLPGSASGSRTT